jgi:hypothetical protein
MDRSMKVPERERRDWLIIPFILGVGFLLVILAGGWALRFSPRWTLKADMDSSLDPNSDFLTHKAAGLIEPVSSSILTQPAWLNLFLTPGAVFVTGTPIPAMTSTFPVPLTAVSSATHSAIATTNPTNTLIFFPATPSPTSKPRPTRTEAPAATPVDPATATATATVYSTSTETPTETSVWMATATPTWTIMPVITDPATATSTFTPTNTPVPIATDPIPGSIGTTPDGVVYNLSSGGTLTLGINLVVNGQAGWDIAYYELPAGGGVLLDWAIIQVSDGMTWYTVFDWGNNVADTNSNVDFNILSNPTTPPERDQRNISSAELYNSTGIAIDLDSVVPPGTYPYIRFIAPPGDVDNQMEIDAIEVIP